MVHERRLPQAEWSKLREDTLDRDNRQCVDRESETLLEVHHIVAVSGGGENKLSNLRTRCNDCYRRAHKQRSTSAEATDTKGPRWLPSLDAVRRVVRITHHPLDRLVVGLPAKTDVGVGERCNIRRSVVALPMTELYPERVNGRKSVLRVRVPCETTEQPGRRERRSDTLVPLDDEVRRLIADWTKIRPGTPHHEYLLASTSDWGRKITPAMVRDRVGDATTEAGADERLTPLTLRQFFAEQYPDGGLVRNYLPGHLAEPPTDYDEIERHYQRSRPRLDL